jgi:hypothetical protein
MFHSITFLNGEVTETLKQYCEFEHKNNGPETPLFSLKEKNQLIISGFGE